MHNLPILRRGYIASIPKVDFNAKGQFVIDAQVFPGSSGSPVFCLIGRKFKLIGIVTETMIKNEILQMVPTQTAPGFHQFLGLGLVIKGNFVKDLIDHVVDKINQNIAENKNESVIEGKNGSPRNGA